MGAAGMSQAERDWPRWGGWCHIPSTFVAEVMGTAGLDWCCVDGQHGFVGGSDLADMVRVLELTGTAPYVRVDAANRVSIGRALDTGAAGVIVPSIRTVAEAVEAAEACRFQPAGTRSWATTRTKLYPDRVKSQMSAPAECHLMIETADALENLEEIARVPGVTGLFVGPEDLQRDLVGGTLDLQDALGHVVETCRRGGLTPGAFCGAMPAAAWVEMGFVFLALGSDSNLLMKAVADAVPKGGMPT